MATKTFYVTRDMKHPLYRTRMLRAGDQLELDGPTARLYTALKAISPDKPSTFKGTGGLHEALTGESPTELSGLAAALNGPANKPAPKRAARKTSKRKTAGKK